MPMLACIYGISLSLLCGSVMMGEDSSLYQQLLSKLLEVLAIVLTVFLIRKIIPMAFPHVRERKLSLPPAYALIAIFLIVPLWLIVKYHLVYVTASSFGNVDLQPVVSTASELKEALVACISAVFLAPVYEELSFRYLALAPFKKKSSQIIFGCLVAAFFGIIHLSNFMGAFMDGLVYMLLFVLTGNIVLSIWTHCCWNLITMIYFVLSHFGVLDISQSSYPTVVRVENTGAVAAASMLAIIGVAVLIVGYKMRSRNVEQEKCS